MNSLCKRLSLDTRLALRRWWTDMPIVRKSLVTLLIPLVAIGVIAVVGYRVEQMQSGEAGVIEHNLAMRDATNEALSLTSSLEIRLMEYQATRSPTDLSRYQAVLAELSPAIERVRARTHLRETEAEADRMLQMLDPLKRGMDRMPALMPTDALFDRLWSGQLVAVRGTMAQLRAGLMSIRETEDQQALLDARQLARDRSRTLTWALAASLLLLGGAAHLSYGLMMRIVTRIQRLHQNAERLKARLPLQRTEPSQDELGRLSQTLYTTAALLASREREILASHSFLAHLVATGPMLIYRYDPKDFGLIFAADNSTRLLGFSREEMLADRYLYLERIHPDDRPQVEETLVQAILQRQEHAEVENRFQHRDGSYLWLYGHIRLQYDADGNPVDATGYSIDVTALKQAEIAADKARQEAEQANRAKSEFLSRMSHELRTPLNAILGFSQLLELEPLTAEGQEGLAYVRRAGDHLLGLIDEVLDISRIEAGRISLVLQPVPACHVAQAALDLIRPLAAQKGVQVRIESQLAESTAVIADEQRLRQVLLNLFSNGVKYNRPEGQVTLTIRRGAAGRIRFEVADTGWGIAETDLPHAFEPFERLGAERSGVEGTGVGLFLCRRLVEAMSGSIAIASAPGEGTTVWVELAEADVQGRQAPADLRDEPEPPSGGPVPHTVLYMEDDPTNLALMDQFLARGPSRRLITAMQGRVGLDLARQHRPALILLDLHLPDMSGGEVLAALRADSLTAGIPVVIVSADALPGVQERLLSRGADAYLTKPLNLKRLQSIIAELLDEGE